MNDNPENNSDEFWKQVADTAPGQPGQPQAPQPPHVPQVEQPIYPPQQVEQAQQPQYVPQPPPPPAYAQQAPAIGTYYQQNQQYRDPNKLSGTLLSLAIYQIVLVSIYAVLFIISLMVIATYSDLSQNRIFNEYLPSTGWLLISQFISFLVIGSLIGSIIGIFRKKKIGIKFTWISIGLTILNRLFGIFLIVMVYNDLYDSFDSYYKPDFPWANTIGAGFLTLLVITVEVVLLLVTPSRRNVSESFS